MKEKSLIDNLQELQKSNKSNFINGKDTISLAKNSKVSLSKVYGVATFYTMFSVYPRGKHIIRVCESISCHMEHVECVIDILKEVLGIDIGETTEDGEFTLEASSCLGMCSVAPVMMIDEVPFGNLSTDEIPTIIARVKEGLQ